MKMYPQTELNQDTNQAALDARLLQRLARARDAIQRRIAQLERGQHRHQISIGRAVLEDPEMRELVKMRLGTVLQDAAAPHETYAQYDANRDELRRLRDRRV